VALSTLTRAHRRDLATLTGLAERDLSLIWARFDSADMARDGLIRVLPDLVNVYGSAAATLGADFYDESRDAVKVAGRFRAIPAELPDVERTDALARWGVGPLFQAESDYASALTLVSGGLQRIVANADRESITGSSVADPQARGWQRVGSGASCEFCSMLIGRGSVYSEAGADFLTHDHCNCGAEPVFEGASSGSARADEPQADPYWRETNDSFKAAALKTKPTQAWGRREADRLLHADVSEADRKRVASLLSQHPEKVVKKVQSVTLASTQEEMQAAGRAVGFSKSEAQNVAAFWRPSTKGITMGPGFDDLTFHHEMGHAVSDLVAKSKMKNYADSFQVNNRFDRHTDYAKTSYRESFAESYAAFLGSGSPLKRVADPHYEATFAVLRKVLA